MHKNSHHEPDIGYVCLLAKPDGFRTWLAKQHSNFCATQLQTNRWFGTGDSRCPSCGLEEERAEHLCQCSDPGKWQLLSDDMAELICWMSVGDNTHPDIIESVERYILGHGTSTSNIPTDILALVISQTKIGWRNFMEGRISSHFYRIQYCHLIWAQSNMTASSWTQTFISKLLHITHSQWIFCNFLLHDTAHGLLRLREQTGVLLQIEALSLSEKNDLPEHSQFLLEFDIGCLQEADFDTQCYWVSAVNAAWQAIYGREVISTALALSQDARPCRSRHGCGHAPQPPVDPPRIGAPIGFWPSPGAQFALEDSNETMKPDWGEDTFNCTEEASNSCSWLQSWWSHQCCPRQPCCGVNMALKKNLESWP